MSVITVDLAPLSIAQLLSIKLADRWSEEFLHDVATICYNGPKIETGFVVTMIMEDGKPSFSVSEYASHYSGDFEDIHNVHTLEEALQRIRERADYWMQTHSN
jgi:hypothetical protein